MTPAGSQAAAGAPGMASRNLVPDLDSAGARWPGYMTEAVRARVGAAAYTFPLQLGAVRLGVLTCYGEHQRTLTTDETTQCLVFAELAAELLLKGPTGDSSDAPGGALQDELQDELHLSNEICQAQGVVKEQHGVSLGEALARMRAHAFATEQDLAALAVGILAGTARLPRDRRCTGTRRPPVLRTRHADLHGSAR